ncbi:MAG: ATP-binding protein [Eubacteriales bacterium]
MTKKIFRSVFLVAMAVLLACFVFILGVLYEYFSSEQEKQLTTQLDLTAAAVEQSGIKYLESLGDTDCRLTLISHDGTVLYDSEGDAVGMENHAEREEVKEAFESGSGKSSRFSSTLTEKTLYYAKLLSDGTVLRISTSQATVALLVIGLLQPLSFILIFALVLSVVLAYRLSKKIVEPLNNLDFDRPLENNAYDELSPLLAHMEFQRGQIKAQEAELESRQSEFYAVIENMNEGLVLLGRTDEILSINPAASEFFGAEDCKGKNFLEVERDHEIYKAVQRAGEKGHGELQVSRRGREYQLSMSRIGEAGDSRGTVILVFDITEKIFAERNRREFTANVSHELKTPLQSIMGSAELIENGMVKEEDMPRFVGHIHSEAKRLVTLIEDIIRLSQLDEGETLPTETVDLDALVSEEIKTLSDAAREKNVSVKADITPVKINGVRQLLHEIVYNLCDNAIKYNVSGGSVTVTVKPIGENSGAMISVADTGIGIPAEHRQRVFERFYRVDKSHSKETGGTGLGLSIVKHAVQYMGGRITLESEVGKGTTITVTFE